VKVRLYTLSASLAHQLTKSETFAVYAYIPTYEGFCRQSDVDCNDVYGISLSRGSFDFSAGGYVYIDF